MSAPWISMISFAAASSLAGAVLFGLRDLFLRPRRSEPSLRRFPQPSPEPSGLLSRFDRWYEKNCRQSGWDLHPTTAAWLPLSAGFVSAGVVWVVLESFLLTAVAAVVGAVAVLAAAAIARQRRMRKFQQQFPTALDLLARAVRAGESLEQAIELVGKASHPPVSQEFNRCSKHLEMGLSMEAAMQGLTQRIDLLDVRIFANTLTAHRGAGGGLPVTMERLATVIRERLDHLQHVRSATGSGRYSAMLIATLGPLLFAYMFFFQPEYGGALLEDSLGRMLLAFAVCSQIVGLYWVSRLLKSDY